MVICLEKHSFLTASRRTLFLAQVKVTSLFDSVFIIGLSVSRIGEKTMLMRSRVQCHVGQLAFFCSLAKSRPFTVSSYCDDNRGGRE